MLIAKNQLWTELLRGPQLRRHVLQKISPHPSLQKGVIPPFVKGGVEGFRFQGPSNYGPISKFILGSFVTTQSFLIIGEKGYRERAAA